MAYTVYETQAAEYDISDILSYLIGNLGSKRAADKWLTEYTGILKKLEEYPKMFEFSRAPGHRQRGFHKFPVGKYVVLYSIDDAEKIVYIRRVFHGSQDYAKYL